MFFFCREFSLQTQASTELVKLAWMGLWVIKWDPSWRDQTMHMYGSFDGFPWISLVNSALFRLATFMTPV